MCLRYKKEEGWKVSIQKEVRLVLNDWEKGWTTEFFNMPEGWKPECIMNPVFPLRLVKFKSSF